MVLLRVLLPYLSVARGLDDGKAPVEELQDKVFELFGLAANLFLRLSQVRAVHLDALEARCKGNLPAIVDDEVVRGEGLGQVVGVNA